MTGCNPYTKSQAPTYFTIPPKSQAQGIPPDKAAYKVVEEIKQYSELGGLIKQQEQVRQQTCMINILTAHRNEAIMALYRLQLQGVTEEKILELDRQVQQLNWQRQREQTK